MSEPTADDARKEIAVMMLQERAIRRRLHENTVERQKLEASLAESKRRRNRMILVARNTLPLVEMAEAFGINRDTARSILQRELARNEMGVRP